MNSLKYSSILALALLIASCSENKPTAEPTSFWLDEEVQNLYNAVDHRSSEAFTPFLSSNNAETKALAIELSSSLQDSTLSGALLEILRNDSIAANRAAAAYAIGQIRSSENFASLAGIYESETSTQVKSEILQAMGKSYSQDNASLLQSTFLKTSCEEAPVWMLYRAMGNLEQEQTACTEFALENLLCVNETARLAAAHFLSRNRKVDLTSVTSDLIGFYEGETAIDVKIALALAFRNSDAEELGAWVNTELNKSLDQRVRINLMRAVASKDLLSSQVLLDALGNQDPGISGYALTLLKRTSRDRLTDQDRLTLESLATNDNPEVRINALALKAQFFSEEKANYEALIDAVGGLKGTYQKAHGIQLLTAFPQAVNYIQLRIDSSSAKPVLSTACQGILDMYSSEKLPAEFNIKSTVKQIIETHDEGCIAVLCGSIMQESKQPFQVNPFLSEEIIDLLRSSQAEMMLPKEVETYNEIEKVLAYVDGREPNLHVPEFNHPIPFDFLANFGDTIRCNVITDLGDIQLALYPKLAPGSVSSFLELVESGFYVNKHFHRVVPNFVLQGGCPRGDGWGSVDYSIRSEFGLHDYCTGALGMASAGKDTESCQWFITHSPTPHLEGRYSIFGYVIDDMETAMKVNVGTRIERIDILN